MNTTVYVLIALLVGFGLAQILSIRRKGDITEEGWRKIREIIYTTIDDGIALYNAGKVGKDSLVDEVVRITKVRIDGSELPTEDKAFWTEERLRRLITPVMEGFVFNQSLR